ncbi:MAG TPA: twin-arginine translocase subunit TatC [Bryobacteraceae bacterium]|jgi:sec-independent protein translocase protein TatC|nr:twin-arginine translocase subunit TatC [Bryobacteraceae bacterium]
MNQPVDPKGAGASRTAGTSKSETESGLERLRNLFGVGGGGDGDDDPHPRSGDGDDEEDGMLRMSFLEHLEELRSRIIKMIIGVFVAICVSFSFTDPLWHFVVQPAKAALIANGFPGTLAQITPMEAFNVVWFKLPLVCSIFLASPWIVYQIWAFISPGLYKREKRFAIPFVLGIAGLFIMGGLFGYFVAFRYGLRFLLSIGVQKDIVTVISVNEYFDMFVNVILGVGLVFELPVLIFFLILLRIVTPGFLIRHSRYAILINFIIAAVVTPTPDIFNMSLFALPMCVLYYFGIFMGYLFVLRREGRQFPWENVLKITVLLLLIAGGVTWLGVTYHWFKLVPHWPFFAR